MNIPTQCSISRKKEGTAGLTIRMFLAGKAIPGTPKITVGVTQYLSGSAENHCWRNHNWHFRGISDTLVMSLPASVFTFECLPAASSRLKFIKLIPAQSDKDNCKYKDQYYAQHFCRKSELPNNAR